MIFYQKNDVCSPFVEFVVIVFESLINVSRGKVWGIIFICSY